MSSTMSLFDSALGNPRLTGMEYRQSVANKQSQIDEREQDTPGITNTGKQQNSDTKWRKHSPPKQCPSRCLSPSLRLANLLWFREGWKLDPAGTGSRYQSDGLWRNWRIMKLLSEDPGLPRSNQNLSLHRANPNLQVLSEVPPRSSKPTSLEAGQMMLTIPGSLQMAVSD